MTVPVLVGVAELAGVAVGVAVRIGVGELVGVCPELPPSPTTPTGVRRSLVVPSPTWPYSFSPQHLAAPAVIRAQLWVQPDQGSRRVDEVARDRVRQILAEGPRLALPAAVEQAMDEVMRRYVRD